MTADIPDYDVLIAGGGLVGGSLAIALSLAGRRVALVEAVSPDSSAQPSFDDRSIALSRGSCQILKQLGIWTRLQASTWPVRNIHVSEQGRFGTAMLDADEQGIPELGFVVKSRDIGLALWDRLTECSSVTVFSPARATATTVAANARSVMIDTEGESVTVTTRLLAVADGARSKLRELLDIQAAERDYGQVAVVTNVEVDPQRAGYTAFERFTSAGPLAVLPGPDGRYAVVLARNSEDADAVMDLSDDKLLELLQSEFGFRLGRFRRIGKRQAYPLQLVTADTVTAERAVVVGNAAHGLHPVAAQGFNLGLRDVASLAELLADQPRPDGGETDAGDSALLESYAEWRRLDQAKVVRFTDGLIRLFGLPGKPVAAGRGLALAAFDMLPGAKQELARQTMGLAGRMTRLARGLSL
jgi:2-octaprenyl-6-methoxyphenol hydroxylase